MTTVVTGAASGIGRAVAEQLAAAGRPLFLIDTAAVPLNDTTGRLRSTGIEVRSAVLDVRDHAGCTAAAAEAAATVAGIEGVAHCAGIVRGDGRLAELEPGAWAEVLAVNLTGTANVLRAVLPHLLARGGGSVVLVSSIAALQGRRRIAAYSASKAGMLGLAQSVVADYAARGVRVNSVCPGPVDTPLSAELSSRAPWNAAGRRATAAEIASTIVWLLGPGSGWVNGAVIPVDAAETAVYGGAFAGHMTPPGSGQDRGAGHAHDAG